MMVHITELKKPSWVLVANVVLLKVYHGYYYVANFQIWKLFCSVFSGGQTEYGYFFCKSSYLVH